MASLSAGKPVSFGTGQYAVLGDDVAIADEEVAATYIDLLVKLGVEVNPIKGFSGNIVEFAKRVFYRSGEELSPIGSKALTHATRVPSFLATLLSDMIRKQILTPTQ